MPSSPAIFKAHRAPASLETLFGPSSDSRAEGHKKNKKGNFNILPIIFSLNEEKKPQFSFFLFFESTPTSLHPRG